MKKKDLASSTTSNPIQYDNFLTEVSRGLKGLNKGLPMGLKKLEGVIGGIQRKRYDLIFAESGVGKSSFVWSSYIMAPYEFVRKGDFKIDLKIKVFSLEVSADQVIAKLVCLKLFLEHKIIVDTQYVFSKGKNKLSNEIQTLIVSLRDYFKTMLESHVEIIDRPMTPTQIKAYMRKFAESNGKFYKDKKGLEQYKPNNPLAYNIVIFDTVGNLKTETYEGKISRKGTIDLHSAICRDFYRNLLGYTIVNVSHMNRSNNNVLRAKSGDIFPKVSDIKETGMLDQDANLILTIFDPMKHIDSHPSMTKFEGYKVGEVLRNRFRALGILKNREGENNIRLGMIYLGENGYFTELPKSTDITPEYYKYIMSKKHYKFLDKQEKDNIWTTILNKKIENVNTTPTKEEDRKS